MDGAMPTAALPLRSRLPHACRPACLWTIRGWFVCGVHVSGSWKAGIDRSLGVRITVDGWMMALGGSIFLSFNGLRLRRGGEDQSTVRQSSPPSRFEINQPATKRRSIEMEWLG